MILTTNQIAQFDIAIESHTRAAIKYSSFNRVQMQRTFDGDSMDVFQEINNWRNDTGYEVSSVDER